MIQKYVTLPLSVSFKGVAMRLKIIVLLLFSTVLFATEHFTFSEWPQQIKLNKERLESEGHNAFVDIYVNKIAEATYKTRGKLFPVGSISYKPLFYDATKKVPSMLVVMKKMPKGYDPKNQDWWYGVYDVAGKKGYYQGRINSCIKCHAQVAETDYLFTQTVMDKIEHDKELMLVLPKEIKK